MEKIQEKDQKQDLELCGWGSYRPSCCQRFKSPGCLLFWLSLAAFLQGMVVNGLVSVVISSLEKRYGMKSSESGLIGSSYDIMTAVLYLPVSYFGGLGLKQRYLSVGTFLIGIASLVFAIPQFSTGLYDLGEDVNKLCEVNNTIAATCAEPEKDLVNFRYVFYLAMALAGTGSVPFFSIAVAYLDESVPIQSSALYLGIYHMVNVFGPTAGYLFGAFSLRYYVDFYRTDITVETHSTRYVGAWWMGFLLTAVLCLLVAVPLFGFPSVLRNVDQVEREKDMYCRKEKKNDLPDVEVYPVQVAVIDGRSKLVKFSRKLLKSLKILIFNPTFLFLTLAEVCEGFLISGAAMFLPKTTEIKFHLSPTSAAFYTGIAVLPAGGLGMFLGALVVNRSNWSVIGILRFCSVMKFVVTVISLFILLHCSNPPFAGVNVDYGSLKHFSPNTFRSDTCFENCTCQQENSYQPICGRDQVTYYSPCHAGCAEIVKTEFPWKFDNCSCITVQGNPGHDAELGACSKKCILFPVFIFLCSVYVLINFMVIIPALSAVLRCVPFNQRAFGLGIQQTFSRLLGFIPGPIVYGYLLDQSCLLWETDCETEGFCSFYDVKTISNLLTLLHVGLNGLTCLFFIIAWKLHNANPGERPDLSG